ncbi:MAG: hypothetical protein LBG18_06510 [Mediterranea sp.]|jgi:hypothetical protein|nr:hypothetical protein [Mediterranea sp.]
METKDLKLGQWLILKKKEATLVGVIVNSGSRNRVKLSVVVMKQDGCTIPLLIEDLERYEIKPIDI